MPTTKTMTAAQMRWNLKNGFAWWELRADGTDADEWYCPIWTRAGMYSWDVTNQRYELWV